MNHMSIPLDNPIEFVQIDATKQSPLISKCVIKVCYVGETPNRNGSVITKQVAQEMAQSLPGAIIVGYYNEQEKDFEEHNRVIDVSNGKFQIKDTTRPYGFVSMDAKVWFEWFEDDGVPHEYLMTEGYLWTGQYPECKRIIEHGNNQSMELDENFMNAHWAKDKNSDKEFFIINEAIVSKLCILGENVEPCFEGASISKVQYAFEDGFKKELFSLMTQMKELLSEGGIPVSELDEKKQLEEAEVTEFALADETAPETDFKKKKEDEEKEKKEEGAEKEDKKENPFEKKNEKSDEADDSKEEDSEEEDDEEKKKKKDKKKYSLDEIPEYLELQTQYSELQAQVESLRSEIERLTSSNEDLSNFKLGIEREQKKDMINNQFFMLSEDDKKDVLENIDNYSLDDIEKELSVICFRNKISYTDTNTDDKKGIMTYSLNDNEDKNDGMPEWVKVALEYEKQIKQ